MRPSPGGHVALPNHPRGAFALQNPLQPDLMSAHERTDEVACLLARGFLRYQLRRPDLREKGLDVIRPASDSCVEPTSRRRDAR